MLPGAWENLENLIVRRLVESSFVKAKKFPTIILEEVVLSH